jgi:hypothetical protein
MYYETACNISNARMSTGRDFKSREFVPVGGLKLIINWLSIFTSPRRLYLHMSVFV